MTFSADSAAWGETQRKRFFLYGCVNAFHPVQLGLTSPSHLAFDAGLVAPDILFRASDGFLLRFISPGLGENLELFLLHIAGIVSL